MGFTVTTLMCAEDVSRESDSRGWRKSSRSYGGGECVEVAAPNPKRIGVRDSKNPRGAVLRFTPSGWNAFVADVRSGALDM